jgi:hypothetical protein
MFRKYLWKSDHSISLTVSSFHMTNIILIAFFLQQDIENSKLNLDFQNPSDIPQSLR